MRKKVCKVCKMGAFAPLLTFLHKKDQLSRVEVKRLLTAGFFCALGASPLAATRLLPLAGLPYAGCPSLAAPVSLARHAPLTPGHYSPAQPFRPSLGRLSTLTRAAPAHGLPAGCARTKRDPPWLYRAGVFAPPPLGCSPVPFLPLPLAGCGAAVPPPPFHSGAFFPSLRGQWFPPGRRSGCGRKAAAAPPHVLAKK